MTQKWMTSGASRLRARQSRTFGARANKQANSAAKVAVLAAENSVVGGALRSDGTGPPARRMASFTKRRRWAAGESDARKQDLSPVTVDKLRLACLYALDDGWS